MNGSNGDSASPYEQKFAGFIEAVEEAEASPAIGKIVLTIDHPEMLGDDYDEIVESLSRLGDARLNLAIVPRKGRA